MEITIQLYHADEKNSNSIPLAITLGMYLNNFFDSAEKIFAQPCISAVGKRNKIQKIVLRSGEEIIVLNRSERITYLPFYLMKSGDLVILESSPNNFTKSAVYSK
jgi:hypothetical protein